MLPLSETMTTTKITACPIRVASSFLLRPGCACVSLSSALLSAAFSNQMQEEGAKGHYCSSRPPLSPRKHGKENE